MFFPQHTEFTQSCGIYFNPDNTFTEVYTELQNSLNPHHIVAEIKSYESSSQYRVVEIKIATIERNTYYQLILLTMKQSKIECCGKTHT